MITRKTEMGQARVSDMLCVMVNMQHQGKIITIRI